MAMLVTFRTIFRGAWRAVRDRETYARSEAGYTLIELIVASALSLVVFAAVLAALETSQRVQNRDTEWALNVQEGRTGLSRMLGEIRQAYSLKETTANSIVFYATLHGIKKEVYYECNVTESTTGYHECVRVATEAGSALPALSTGVPVVRSLLNPSSVFSYSNPTVPVASDVVTALIELPASGTLKLASASVYKHHIVLKNAAYIRNLNLGA
jgi:prepilin-type N-terminal cleavage/methylation domain-containing protein